MRVVEFAGRSVAAVAVALLFLSAAPSARAQEPLDVPIVYLTQQEKQRIPLSLVEPILEDRGLMGARAAIEDNATTGRFLKHEYSLTEVVVPEDGDLGAAFDAELAAGRRLFIADLHAEQLLAVADRNDADQALIFNTRAQDDRLRNADCRANVLHVMPSDALKADALAQYATWKANFGNSLPAASAVANSTVPEPSAIVLLALGGIAVVTRRLRPLKQCP